MLNTLPALGLALALVLPAAAPAPAPTQDPAQLAAVVDRQVELLGADLEGDLWQRALALRAASDVAGGGLDPLLDGRLEHAGERSDAEVLLIAAARLLGEDPDLGSLRTLLLERVRSSEPEAAALAADMLARPAFAGLPREQRVEVGAELLAVAKSTDVQPHVRLRAAMAAHALGDGHGKRQARQELLEFLRSADPELRGLAALGLAGIHEEVAGDLERELERLAELPGDKGALAEAYLDLERSKRLRDRRLRELEERISDELLPGDLARFDAVLQMVVERHLDGEKFDRDDLVDAALAGMLRALDRHSSYLSSEAYGEFVQDLEAEYGGIGAYVGEDPADGLFTITRPIYSGPAYEAGLQTDDKIVRVGDWPTIGQPTDDVIKRLKGKPGTTVELYVWRRGMDAERIERPTPEMRVEVERAIIEIPAVHDQMLPGGVGMVELTNFSRVAGREFAEALVDLRSQGMTSLVVDLRRNSGGLLSEAVRVADLLLPAGKAVVHTEYRGQPTQTLYTQQEPLLPLELPVAVLVSRYTASASEIVSGALQDHGRAVLVGDRTYGKGSVQNLERVEGYYDDAFDDENRNGRFDDWEVIRRDWDEDGEFDFAPRVKLTIARYLLPSGRSIHRELDSDGTVLSEGGVEPDVVVELPRVEAWRWEERLDLRDERVPRNYVDQYWDEYRERLVPLATTDFKDPSLYPGFDALYESLGTPLPKDDVRQLLRSELRRRVQDERGGAFPLGDFQEDVQVQEAIRRLLDDLGASVDDVEAYRRTFTEQPEVHLRAPVAVAQSGDDALQSARESLRRVREEGGSLTQAELDLVLELLGSGGPR